MDLLTNFDAFTLRDLQNCLALLAVLESAGMPDIKSARRSIAEASRLEVPANPPTRKAAEPCPHCSAPLRRCSITGDVYCSNCRYSRMGGE